ncbi:MAG: DUF3857 domain-containing transglutaminase family protein [Gemmatimonas sp.]
MTPAAAQTALPAQPSDSIVRLAINPASRPGVQTVTLLDETVFRVEADGRSTRRTRQVVQLLTEAAARGRAEQSFGYAPGHQGFTLHWARVLKPTGEVLSDKPALEQDADVPAAMRNPVYQDQKIHRVSLANIGPGTILDLSWTMEEKAPYRAGDFYDLRYVNSPNDVVRFRYVLDAPAALSPRIIETNVQGNPNVRRADSVSSGRRLTTWIASNQPRVIGEPFIADSNGVIQTILVTAPGTWADLALWYHGLSKDRYTLSSDIARKVDSIVAASNARTRLDTVKALHRWAAQDVRYVSVALGIGGYQPRTPEQVLSTGFGDCKDKATLFVAALRKYGIEANPVLLASTGRTNRNAPSTYQFDHAIAAVRTGTSWTYTDLTAEAIPFGMIPLAYQGGMGLVVLPDGKSEQVTFPESAPDSNTNVIRIAGTLDADGRSTLRVTDRSTGTSSIRVRQSFYSPVDTSQRGNAMRALGAIYFKDGSADSLVTFNGKDLSADVQLQFRVSTSNALRSVGTMKLFTIPPSIRGPALNFSNVAKALAAAPARKFPVDVSRILGPSTSVMEFELTLPEGWTAELPKPVVTTSIAGKYETMYTQNARVLRITRRVQGARGVYPAERIAEVTAWLRTIAADDVEFIQLKPPG